MLISGQYRVHLIKMTRYAGGFRLMFGALTVLGATSGCGAGAVDVGSKAPFHVVTDPHLACPMGSILVENDDDDHARYCHSMMADNAVPGAPEIGMIVRNLPQPSRTDNLEGFLGCASLPAEAVYPKISDTLDRGSFKRTWGLIPNHGFVAITFPEKIDTLGRPLCPEGSSCDRFATDVAVNETWLQWLVGVFKGQTVRYRVMLIAATHDGGLGSLLLRPDAPETHPDVTVFAHMGQMLGLQIAQAAIKDAPGKPFSCVGMVWVFERTAVNDKAPQIDGNLSMLKHLQTAIGVQAQ